MIIYVKPSTHCLCIVSTQWLLVIMIMIIITIINGDSGTRITGGIKKKKKTRCYLVGDGGQDREIPFDSDYH